MPDKPSRKKTTPKAEEPAVKMTAASDAPPKEPLPAPQPEIRARLPRIDGKTILIAGGTGRIGSLLTAVCLGSGATVVVPSRRQERLDALRAKLNDAVTARFVPVVGSLADVASGEQLRDSLRGRIGRLDSVVASLGAYWEGPPLTEVSFDDWQRTLNENLTTHFVAARTFVPMIQSHGKGGTYVIITGSASEVPSFKSGPISIAAAGVHMLARVLADEITSTGIRVEELIYSTTRYRAHWLPMDALMRETLHVLATGTRSS